MTFRYSRLATLFLLACALCGCSKPPGASPASENLRARPASAAQPAGSRNLSQDEAAGGHVLRKHVGRSDDQLRQRLEHEPNISAASSYTDRDTAEQAVGAALAEGHGKIDRWLDRPGGHPNLVLDYDGPRPLGRTLRRGASSAEPCNHALVVLKYDGDNNYHVLTSYPECR